MEWLTLIGSITAVIVSLGVLFAGSGYAYAQFKKGASEQGRDEVGKKVELLEYLQTENEGYKKVIKELSDKIDAQGKDIAALRATIEEKDKQIQTYLAIFKDRDPDTQQFQQDMRMFVEESRAYYGKKVETLTKIASVMEKVDAHMGKGLDIQATVKPTQS